MRRTGLLIVGVAVALAGPLSACSGGGSKADPSDATSASSSSAPSTASATTTTSTAKPPVEDEVKAAYLAYWAMADRLFAAPNPDDPELAVRAAEPLLSFVRDNLGTKAAQGHIYRRPSGRPNSHRIDSTDVGGGRATIKDCYVDGSVEFDSAGAIVDDGISTRTALATLILEGGAWKLSGLQFIAASQGVSGCAA